MKLLKYGILGIILVISINYLNSLGVFIPLIRVAFITSLVIGSIVGTKSLTENILSEFYNPYQSWTWKDAILEFFPLLFSIVVALAWIAYFVQVFVNFVNIVPTTS